MPISKFKAACIAVLEKVQRTGQPVRITRSGEPVKIIGDIVSPASDEAVFGEWSSPEDEEAFWDL